MVSVVWWTKIIGLPIGASDRYWEDANIRLGQVTKGWKDISIVSYSGVRETVKDAGRSGVDRFHLFGCCMRRTKGTQTSEFGFPLFQKCGCRQLLQLQEMGVERV